MPRPNPQFLHPLAYLTVALLLVLQLAAPGHAAQADGGMLFSYQPHAGERAGFDEGYRDHLDWHREKRDSLPWYGWDVIAGRRMGQFVDGTFGIGFEALDRRVDPAGDAAHARRSFAPHAAATGRWAVRLRRSLSTATPLEKRSLPAPLAQVVTFVVPLGDQGRLEEILREVRERAMEAGLRPYSVYESVVGGSDAEFTVMVWRNALASFDRAGEDPVAVIRGALSGQLGAALRVESELWRLRRDLTLIPNRDEGSEGAAQAEESAAPDQAEATESEVWRTVVPGGETGCAFGDPFEFWVRDGSPEELLLILSGGGACWTHGTCHPDAEFTFQPEVLSNEHVRSWHGIVEASEPENPFRRATLVFVPYCTGDFHLGDRRVTYEPPAGSELGPVMVNHAGYRNVTAVLDHLIDLPTSPSRITVVGISAGGVASPVVAARVAERFSEVAVRQIGDGAAGLRFPGNRDLLLNWGADEALAADGYGLPESGDGFASLYIMAAAEQPRIRFSQVATASDERVARGLRIVGEDPGSVKRRIEETYAELEEAGICFSGYLLPGTRHTIVWRPELYSAEVKGVSLVERLQREVLERPCPE